MRERGVTKRDEPRKSPASNKHGDASPASSVHGEQIVKCHVCSPVSTCLLPVPSSKKCCQSSWCPAAGDSDASTPTWRLTSTSSPRLQYTHRSAALVVNPKDRVLGLVRKANGSESYVRVVPSRVSKRITAAAAVFPCGLPGQMLLVPEAALTQQRTTADISPDYMAPEHEFRPPVARAAVRAIFDELGIPGPAGASPVVVTDGDAVYPVSQAKGVSGTLSLSDGSPCATTPAGIVRPDCRLYVDFGNRAELRNLLRMPYAASVSEFTLHACQQPVRTAKKGAKALRDRFIVHKSIKAAAGCAWCTWAVSRFLQWRLPEGTSSVALVSLAGDEARVLANLTRIEALSRRALRLLVPSTAAAAVCRWRKDSPRPRRSAGASVVLVTHAEQLQGANETLQLGPQLSTAGLVLSTVALGAYADAALELLAGRCACCSVIVIGAPLRPPWPARIHFTILDLSGVFARVVRREEILVRAGGEQRTSFLVDANLGAGARVTLTGRAVEFVAVRLRDPDDELYHETSRECTKDVQRTQSTLFYFQAMKPGRWTLQLSPAGGASQLSSPVTLAVTSRPRAHEAPPVRLWARPSAPWVVYPAVASLHARLSKGSDAVLDASVWASVGRPRGRHVVITLHDDGLGRRSHACAGADTTAGDGVYSAFFTDHSGPGRYRVAVRATDSEGSARVVTPHICHSSVTDLARKAGESADFGWVSLKGFAVCRCTDIVHLLSGSKEGEPVCASESSYRLADLKLDAGSEQWAPENPQQDVVPSGHFERYFDAGSFQLVGYREHSAIGPGPVTDLLVEASLVRGSRWLLELSWTAMGAHMDAGAGEAVAAHHHRNSA
ncbi:hypothetical protein HPB48_016741 [Haemaphysalis longicornis]|uniref:Uncharacterized protein n=1 Tax=Haemaphysalis longicornis TaxID=44386 RepID=A0A9J6G0X4_HAELO|nr:hypothetical protein HPB48_016741 [Haemaphysalis longicornis]